MSAPGRQRRSNAGTFMSVRFDEMEDGVEQRIDREVARRCQPRGQPRVSHRAGPLDQFSTRGVRGPDPLRADVSAQFDEHGFSSLCFSTDTGVPNLEQLLQFQHDPLAAQLMLADSSGFNVHNNVFDDEHMMHVAPIPDDLLLSRARSYAQAMDPTAMISACASCGERHFDEDVHCEIVELTELQSLLMPEDRKAVFLNSKLLQAIATTFTHQGSIYYLHPELQVSASDQHPTFAICENCLPAIQNGDLPPFNVGNGHDYGSLSMFLDHIGGQLTYAERLVVAPVLRVRNMMKFSASEPSKIVGSTIAFKHDGPMAVATALPRTSLTEHLTVAFIGDKADWDKMMSPSGRRSFIKNNALLSINSRRCRKYLELKSQVDPTFAAIRLNVGPVIEERLSAIPGELLDNALICDDEDDLMREHVSHSDISRPVPAHESDEMTTMHAPDVTVDLGLDVRSCNLLIVTSRCYRRRMTKSIQALWSN